MGARSFVSLSKAPRPGDAGWADFYDLVVIHTSGGKDSERALSRAMGAVNAAGAGHKVAGLHLWLDERDTDDPRIEWPEVPELAAEQARRHGLPLGAGGGWQVWDDALAGRGTARTTWAGQMHYARRDVAGDLLDDVATRRKRDGSARGWPTMWTRYCTSDWKTAVGRAFTEHLCAQIRAEQGLTRPVRVLQVMGFRAEESADRANRPAFGLNGGVSAKASRHVWEWLPIHGLLWGQVWREIRVAGVPYHPVYDRGLTRLSCRHCVMGSRGDLGRSKALSPATATAYIAVETALGDPFQHNKPLALVPVPDGEHGFDAWWTTCPACGGAVLADTRERVRFCPTHAADGPWNYPAPSEQRGCTALRPVASLADADDPWVEVV